MYSFIRIVLLAITFASCNPCSNLDCLTSDYNGQFRIVSKLDKSDLVFGPAAIYERDSIKVYALKDGDTTFYPVEFKHHSHSNYDSILTVDFVPATPVAFIQLGSADTDTLRMIYASRDTRCCGTVTKISSFQLNNLIELGANGEVKEIRK